MWHGSFADLHCVSILMHGRIELYLSMRVLLLSHDDSQKSRSIWLNEKKICRVYWHVENTKLIKKHRLQMCIVSTSQVFFGNGVVTSHGRSDRIQVHRMYYLRHVLTTCKDFGSSAQCRTFWLWSRCLRAALSPRSCLVTRIYLGENRSTCLDRYCPNMMYLSFSIPCQWGLSENSWVVKHITRVFFWITLVLSWSRSHNLGILNRILHVSFLW